MKSVKIKQKPESRPDVDSDIKWEKFEEFYRKHKTVREVVDTDEWDEFYSHFYEFTDDELDIRIGETLMQLEAYSPQRRMEEVEKCMNNFEYFCHKFVKILHIKHGTIPFVPYKYQRRVCSYYVHTKYSIISKFRQGGLTTLAVLYSLWLCLFQEGKVIYVLSKTDREAIVAGEIVDRALETMPKWLWEKDTIVNKHEKVFGETGSKICFYTPEAIRGKSASLVIIDEAAFIKDMDRHWKSMYPVVATGGDVFVISTVNGIGNWYEIWYHKALAGKNEFSVIELDYWEHPEYATPEWEEKTRSNMGEKAWRQEILRSFLGSGETYINSKLLEALTEKTNKIKPKRCVFPQWNNQKEEDTENVGAKDEWDQGAFWVFKEPQDGHEYIIGVDTAEGVEDAGDNSCFQIIDISTMEQVAEFYSNKIPPVFFAGIVNQIGIYYKSALVVVEGNAIGNAVLSALQYEHAYENLYYDPKGRHDRPGIKIGPGNRSPYLESIQNRIINNSIKINSRRLVNELNTFIYNSSTKRAEAQRKKHDDAIMALAFAVYIRDSQYRNLPLGMEGPKESLNAFKTAEFEKIKKQIMEGAPLELLAKQTPLDLLKYANQFPQEFELRRKNDGILKEFGW
jgi:hypothetical protein